jgi:peptidase MA superfamily protein
VGAVRTLARALLAVSLAATLLAMPQAIAADPLVTFGPATATSRFLDGVDVSEPVRLPAGVSRVEALVSSGSSPFTNVAQITPLPAAGETTLSYHLKTPSGAIVPNTVVRLRFRVTIGGGAGGGGTEETGPVATVRYSDTRFDWRTEAGDLVRVHWVEGDAAFGRRALRIAEDGIAKAAALLGVTETAPIDFFVYADETSFREVLGPGARENVGGVAFPDIRTLVADIRPSQVDDAWVGIVIPHELTHLVFDTATQNPYHQPPHWMNEGLAVYLSQGFGSGDRSEVVGVARDGELMPLPALDGQFPTFGDRFGLAYAESVSAIDFLVRTYGQPALVRLIRSYADGRTDDEAFMAALGVDVAGFEAAWVADLGTTEPIAAGPKPDPAGPVPPGWGGPAPTPGLAPGSSPGTAPVSGGSSIGDLVTTAVVTAVIVLAVMGLVAVAWRRRRRPEPPAPPAPLPG